MDRRCDAYSIDSHSTSKCVLGAHLAYSKWYCVKLCMKIVNLLDQGKNMEEDIGGEMGTYLVDVMRAFHQ